MDKFTEFVLEHEGDEVEALVLQKGRWPDIDVAKAADTIAGRRKMRLKAPSWYGCAEIVYPSRLCVEQCSSEAASEINARIITAILPDWAPERPKVADLTGGLGVDSWAFSKVAERVLYVEKDSVLAEAARHNFAVLGCNNIEVVNAEVSADGLVAIGGETESAGLVDSGVDGGKKEADGWEVLRKFASDIIYLDPSRRGEAGEKVFRLEDCRPNILGLRDKLLELALHVVVKLSPMADIDEVVRQLGPCCRWVNVISVDNECKEVLVTMERGFDEECMIIAECGGVEAFGFSRSEEAAAVAHYLSLTKPEHTSETDTPTQKSKTHDPTDFSHLVGKILLEPDKAVMKAAPFKLLSEVYGLVKLDVSTHYYIYGENFGEDSICGSGKSEEAGETCGEGGTETHELPFEIFRQFKILRVEPLNKRTLRAISRDYPNAEVTARNIPPTTDELRKRLAVSSSKHDNSPSKNNIEPFDHPSDSIHIFALRAAGQNLLFITERMSQN